MFGESCTGIITSFLRYFIFFLLEHKKRHVKKVIAYPKYLKYMEKKKYPKKFWENLGVIWC